MPMATTTKTDKILIQIGNEVIELTGDAKKEFIAQQEKDTKEFKALNKKRQEQKELQISAYKKLGLTDEELAALGL